jgi:hypothetical protein
MNFMSLENVLAAGATTDPTFVKQPVEWKTKDAQGDSVVHNFDVFIRKEMTAADFDFIYSKKSDNEDENVRACKQIHRFVRMGDGSEVIPFQKALTFKVSLIVALLDAITAVQAPPKPESKEGEAEDETKKLAPPTNSISS